MTINEIFKTYAPEYINRFGDLIPSEHRKVIDAIINCRTRHYGTMIYKCEKCGQNHVVYQSCGNRHCPSCQHHKAHQWLVKQIEKQLQGHHFMITFTVPENLRRSIRSNQGQADALTIYETILLILNRLSFLNSTGYLCPNVEESGLSLSGKHLFPWF